MLNILNKGTYTRQVPLFSMSSQKTSIFEDKTTFFGMALLDIALMHTIVDVANYKLCTRGNICKTETP